LEVNGLALTGLVTFPPAILIFTKPSLHLLVPFPLQGSGEYNDDDDDEDDDEDDDDDDIIVGY